LPVDSKIDQLESAVYRKVSLRLIPFLFFCYILAYLDRVNVGFAKLQMGADLGFSEAVYGTGAGLFFIGYFFLEVPSNIMLARVGAKIWIARIMIMWGLVSAAMMFVDGKTSFYLLRFLLGVAEAGFFPGIILYLTYWFPKAYRARMVAWFMTAVPLAGVIGGPLSGWILNSLSGMAGLNGWQWLFLVEGLMPVLAGVWVLFYLDNGPSDAGWLDKSEKELLLSRICEDEQSNIVEGDKVSDVFCSLRVWLLGCIYFCMVMGLYGISFWLPQIIKDALTTDNLMIGLIFAIPWGIAAMAMVGLGWHSDRTGERRWHVALACLVSSLAFIFCSLSGLVGWPGFVALIIATSGIMAALSTFWALPTAILKGTAAAAGIAWINSFGNLAGYVSPELVGMIRDANSNDMTSALLLLGVSMLVAACLTIGVAGPAFCSKNRNLNNCV